MNILVFLLMGLIAGFLAGKIVHDHGFGIFGDLVVGMVGAFVGGIFFTSTQYRSPNFLGATLTAALGAVALLTVVKLVNLALAPSKNLSHQ